MSRGTYTNHPKQKRLEKLENTHKQAYNRVLPLINYPCPRSEGSYERMFQSSGRETIIIKTTLFLSFQIAQGRQGRAALHVFLAFFLMGKVVQANINSLTKGGQAQTTPDRESMAAQKPQTYGQWSRRWSMVSSSSLQRGHLLISWNSLFFN